MTTCGRPVSIICNPPYRIADQFVLRALAVASGKVAMFLRLQWLEGARRHDRIFAHRPPHRVWLPALPPLPGNVWIGVSVERQDFAYRLAILRAVDASVRFVSAEPLLRLICRHEFRLLSAEKTTSASRKKPKISAKRQVGNPPPHPGHVDRTAAAASAES